MEWWRANLRGPGAKLTPELVARAARNEIARSMEPEPPPIRIVTHEALLCREGMVRGEDPCGKCELCREEELFGRLLSSWPLGEN